MEKEKSRDKRNSETERANNNFTNRGEITTRVHANSSNAEGATQNSWIPLINDRTIYSRPLAIPPFKRRVINNESLPPPYRENPLCCHLSLRVGYGWSGLVACAPPSAPINKECSHAVRERRVTACSWQDRQLAGRKGQLYRLPNPFSRGAPRNNLVHRSAIVLGRERES